MRKRITAVAIMIGGVLGFAGVAVAHPSSASATCQGGIVYEGHDYPASGSTVTVKIDGATVAGFPKTFGPAISGTVPFTDKTVAHSWQVVWDRSNGTEGDRAQSGSVASCAVAQTTTTVAATTTTAAAPTTTLPISTTTVAAPATTVAEPTTILFDVPIPPTFTPHELPGCAAGVCPAPVVVLPQTGISAGDIAWVAAIVSMLGALLVVSTRSRRRT